MKLASWEHFRVTCESTAAYGRPNQRFEASKQSSIRRLWSEARKYAKNLERFPAFVYVSRLAWHLACVCARMCTYKPVTFNSIWHGALNTPKHLVAWKQIFDPACSFGCPSLGTLPGCFATLANNDDRKGSLCRCDSYHLLAAHENVLIWFHLPLDDKSSLRHSVRYNRTAEWHPLWERCQKCSLHFHFAFVVAG